MTAPLNNAHKITDFKDVSVPTADPSGRTPVDAPAPSVIQASWQRALASGLDMNRPPSGASQASTDQLSRLLHTRKQLVATSCPEMRRLGEQIHAFDGILLLADPSGIILCSLGDDSFAARAARVALQAGANWNEKCRGTNAIGTVIATGHAVAVDGMEHYMSSNGFLSCAAAPIYSSDGEVAGVLNASNRYGRMQRGMLELVCRAASRIERRLFVNDFWREVVISLYSLTRNSEALNEGLLALSEKGFIVGADEVARKSLGIHLHEIGKLRMEDIVAGYPSSPSIVVSCAHMPLHSTRKPTGDPLYAQVTPGRVDARIQANAARL